MDAHASAKEDEELVRRDRRAEMKALNERAGEASRGGDASLRRHTALIKRMRQGLGADGRDQMVKEVEALALEKYIDEIANAACEGVGKCKTEKDVWAAVEIMAAVHRRFPTSFTPALVALLSTAIAAPSRATLAALPPEQREKEDSARVVRQRPVLRVCSELALVGIIRDAPGRSGGEWIMKAIKELLSNDPSLSSLPLLSTFLRSFSRPFLGINPPAAKQSQASLEPGSLSSAHAKAANAAKFPPIANEANELVERDIRDRFRRMCEGYFESVSKKLVIEHNRLRDQDRRNHEAYIRSGEIFEDRQQAYEKMAKNYERLLAACQTLSELLYLPLPNVPTNEIRTDSIGLSSASAGFSQEADDVQISGSRWEDEEERKFYEDLQDLKDFVPRSFLGIDEKGDSNEASVDKEKEKEKEKEDEKRLEEELAQLSLSDIQKEEDGSSTVVTPPRASSPDTTPTQAVAQGPSQLLTALLANLSDATNRSLIDQAAVDFAFLNSKAARKRLVKFLTQVPRNRLDLIPHYSRLVATLNPYMPDVGKELIANLEEEFRYLQRKKNVVELADTRHKNVVYFSCLTKFKVVPIHVILHILKVFIDDFSPTNIENTAMLLEGCGRYLLRGEETKDRMTTMLEAMKRKQGMQHIDQRLILLLENAYYQCNPPERGPRQEKEIPVIVQFIRHLFHDVLARKTIDKVLRLLRKLNWEDPVTLRALHNTFTKPWKMKYSNISLIAMLVYDLQRYHTAFAISVVDQVLEDVRRGLETNLFKNNQRRVATMKLLGELYIYRLVGSNIIFDTMWSLVTFGHPEGRPLPGQICPIDAPDDFFRIRLVCILLDTCGMCFDRGSQKRKLDNFITFLQLYVLTKDRLPMDVDFMLTDSLEALRPKITLFKNFDEAAAAVDELVNIALQNSGATVAGAEGEESDAGDGGDDSGDDQSRRNVEDEEEDDVDEEQSSRAGSADELVLRHAPEVTGPTAEEDAEFTKELAKLVADHSESRKVDKKTALALWDSNVLPGGIRRRRGDEDSDEDGEGASEKEEMMKFTVISRKGNKQQLRQLPIPASSSLAMQILSQQAQDKEEKQELKRLVLDSTNNMDAEEMKAMEATGRSKPIRIRLAG